MNKILVGVIVGAVLGFIDGATAWFTPEVRSEMLGIVIGSTFKGVLAGVAAGWFARRVQSVPKGIAFGFAVGLILAFAVAAMPSATGEHYWWQIMVPGSILGGVIGWATQRYGRPAVPRQNRAAAAAMMILVAALGAQAGEHDHAAKASAPAAFERLKGLAGTWDAAMMKTDGEATEVQYRVTGNGTALMETMFAGTPHEMITMYTVDGDSILASHYCSGGNQPRLRMNPARSDANTLVFEFEAITGTTGDHYINGVTFRFSGDGRAVEEWSSKGQSEHMRLYLRERK
jgi:hypothetical protein